MEIYLVRHGIPEEGRPGQDDSERRLSREGFEITEKVARAFAARVPNVGMILHSPYLRAQETAAIFHKFYPGVETRVAPKIRPHDPPELALGYMEGAELDSLMLVGHEPFMSSLASLLITGSPRPVLSFDRAGIAGIEWEGRRTGRLLFLLTPGFLIL